jgi:GNAT superfamily N-acetyltransferase
MGKYANVANVVADAPDVPGLVLRGFRGEVDYPAMVDVINGSKEADGLEWTNTVAEIARDYERLVNCDPYRDMLFAEVQGQVVGYSRMWWQREKDDQRIYAHFCFLLPEWRGQGIRCAMLRQSERRLREIAASQQDGRPQGRQGLLQATAADTEDDWATLLSCENYEVERYEFDMLRPNLDDIPSLPLPAGLEVRPARPEHYRAIWDAAAEAFQDHWGAEEWTEEAFVQWQDSPLFAPQLWQVAWDGEQVAGVALNYIDQEENVEYGYQRGYTEDIAVRRPWRRRGLARALLARSLRLFKEQGMTEAALGVQGIDPDEALFYQSMGFGEIRRHLIFRKPLS